MIDTQVYENLFHGYRTWWGWATDRLEQPAVDRRPDPQTKYIAIIIWQMAGALNALLQSIFTTDGPEGGPWSRHGWADKNAYDPIGKGWGEVGNLAGYGPDDIAERPQYTFDDPLRHFDQGLESFGYLKSDSSDTFMIRRTDGQIKQEPAAKYLRSISWMGWPLWVKYAPYGPSGNASNQPENNPRL